MIRWQETPPISYTDTAAAAWFSAPEFESQAIPSVGDFSESGPFSTGWIEPGCETANWQEA